MSRIALACALIVLGTAATVEANPLDAFGYGARAQALGSAYSAVADDTAANYYNPAGLARARSLRIDLGYQIARPLVEVSGQRQSLLDTRGLTAGVVLPGTLAGVRFAFGVALFLPDQHVTRIRVLSFDQPRLHMYDNRTQRFFLAANLAVRLWRGLYVGGGLSFLSRSSGTVQLKGQIGLTDPAGSTLTSAVAATAALTMPCAPARVVMSPSSASARPPAERTSAATASAASRRMSLTTTSAPSAAKASA